MQFIVLPATARPTTGKAGIFLERDNWDDGSFRTLFHVHYSSDGRDYVTLGAVKIARIGMTDGGETSIPNQFHALSDEFFSLGQDVDYYENLKALGDDARETILRALRDAAFDQELFRRRRHDPAMDTSLLRSVVEETVVGQYHRIATGGRTFVEYRIVYRASEGLQLDFEVIPGSKPPTNVHVLIGSNGVGKTQLLNRFAQAVVRPLSNDNVDEVVDLERADSTAFANVISISFSAFDVLKPVDAGEHVQYTHVTLDRNHSPEGRTASMQFAEVVLSLVGARRVRWRHALETLGTDPLFRDGLEQLTVDDTEPAAREQVEEVFNHLSSGHKIVALAISYLADLVTERTVVLIDEPETHLHPPLLAAFIRALSDLLVDRNGVAIIATHSPVVVQETPKTCVWMLRRVGDLKAADRPDLETFGENVGTLTREVFGLETTQSGFHNELAQAVSTGLSYEEVVEQFRHQLGTEAKGIVRTLIAIRDRRAR
ncbi:AAA family ATPase [Dactylosporangium sp. NPDC005555]|uniref:AAA family ATPase n=1 Tax=Dactylosporangium sp. NPDC005555 TaxID=3154889 RepID=UPI0033BDF327